MNYFRVSGLVPLDNEVSTLRSIGRNIDSVANSDEEGVLSSQKNSPEPKTKKSPPLNPVVDKTYRDKYGYKGPYERKIDLTTKARLKNKHIEELDTERLNKKFPLPG